MCEHAEQAEAHAQSAYKQNCAALEFISKSMENVKDMFTEANAPVIDFMIYYQHHCEHMRASDSALRSTLHRRNKPTKVLLTVYAEWPTTSTVL